jgi:hypothetical protein
MKTGAIWVLAMAVFLGAQALGAAEPTSPSDCVMQFFEASKNGDLNAMKQLMAGSFYNQRRTLLEENTTYPDFLRKHYADTRLQVISLREERGGWVAEVRIKFPDGTVDSNKWLVQKDASGTWKIIDQVHP